MAKVADLTIDSGIIADDAITGTVTSTSFSGNKISVTAANPSGYPVQIGAGATLIWPGDGTATDTVWVYSVTVTRRSDGKSFYSVSGSTGNRNGHTDIYYPHMLDPDGPVGATYDLTIALSVSGPHPLGIGTGPTIVNAFLSAIYVRK